MSGLDDTSPEYRATQFMEMEESCWYGVMASLIRMEDALDKGRTEEAKEEIGKIMPLVQVRYKKACIHSEAVERIARCLQTGIPPEGWTVWTDTQPKTDQPSFHTRPADIPCVLKEEQPRRHDRTTTTRPAQGQVITCFEDYLLQNNLSYKGE